jgi:hypothetical protein
MAGFRRMVRLQDAALHGRGKRFLGGDGRRAAPCTSIDAYVIDVRVHEREALPAIREGAGRLGVSAGRSTS